MKIGKVLKGVNREGTVADGGYLCLIKKADVGETGKGYKAFKLQLQVVETSKDRAAYKGMILFPQFSIGNEEDPDAETPETWNGYGGRELAKLCDAVGIDLDDDLEEEELCEALRGEKVFVVVTETVQQEGDFKGRKQNRYQGWYDPKSDDAVPFSGIEAKGKGASKRTARAVDEEVKPAKRKAAPPPDDDDEEEDEEEPAPKKRGRPAGSKNKAKAEPEADADEEEEEEEDERPAKKPKRPAADEVEEDEDEEEDEPAPKKRRG